jgi:hypothetical protein
MLLRMRKHNPHCRLLVMGHYPLVYPEAIAAKRDHALSAGERQSLLDLLDEFQVALFLHGHKHNRWALRRKWTLHLNCGSAGMLGRGEDRRPGYLKIYLPGDGAETSGIRVESHWLAGDDADAEGSSIDWRYKPIDI